MSDAIDHSEMRHILRIPSMSIRPLVRPICLARCMPLNKTGIDLKVDVTETSIAFRHRTCSQYARGTPRTRRTEWIRKGQPGIGPDSEKQSKLTGYPTPAKRP